MKNLFYAGAIIIAGILQLSLLDLVRVFGAKPDLLLALAVMVSLLCPSAWAVGLSLFAGIFKDIFSAAGFGINTLLFPLWSVFIIVLNRKISLENKYVRIALAFAVCFFHNFLSGLAIIYSGRSLAAGIYTRLIFLNSLYTSLALYILFMVDDFLRGVRFGSYIEFIRNMTRKLALGMRKDDQTQNR